MSVHSTRLEVCEAGKPDDVDSGVLIDAEGQVFPDIIALNLCSGSFQEISRLGLPPPSLSQMSSLGSGGSFAQPSSGSVPEYVNKTLSLQPQGDLRHLWHLVTQVYLSSTCSFHPKLHCVPTQSRYMSCTTCTCQDRYLNAQWR